MTQIQIGSDESLYFAYGTLLELAETHKFCPGAESMGVFRLKGYRLGFAACGPDPSTGGCTLESAPGNTMYGILYKMPLIERQKLDEASGYDLGLWAKLDITILDNDDNPVTANTSYIPEPGGPHIPTDSYTRPILSGARDIPLPSHYIEQLESIVRGEDQS